MYCIFKKQETCMYYFFTVKHTQLSSKDSRGMAVYCVKNYNNENTQMCIQCLFKVFTLLGSFPHLVLSDTE